jgi:hypothetical protein
VQSVNEEAPVDEDLDAVALQKAFEFAARSVVLVCVLSILFRTSVLTPAHLDTHLPHHYTAASFLCTDHIRGQGVDCVGRYRHFVDLLQCLRCRVISPLRKQDTGSCRAVMNGNTHTFRHGQPSTSSYPGQTSAPPKKEEI